MSDPLYEGFAAITSRNIVQVLNAANPNSCSPKNYERLMGFFSDNFREKASVFSRANGRNDLSDVLLFGAGQIEKIKGNKSLSELADRKPELLSVLCSCDKSFAAFVTKFIPNFDVMPNSIEQIIGKETIAQPIQKGKILSISGYAVEEPLTLTYADAIENRPENVVDFNSR